MVEQWLSVDVSARHFEGSQDTVFTWVSSKGMPEHRRTLLEVQNLKRAVDEPLLQKVTT